MALEQTGPVKTKYSELVSAKRNKRFPNITSIISHTLSNKNNCVEPEMRMVGGVRTYAIHRFPIIGGKTLQWLMVENITANNAFLKKLRERQTVK
jgi:hypothetical protein